METKIKTVPAAEPVTTAEAKTHMNIDFSTDDTYIGTLITAAREYVEQTTNRKLISQTWYGYLPAFPSRDYIELPFGTLQTVTSVKYKNSAAVEETLSNTQYIVDTSFTLGRIVLGYGYTWPTFTEYPTSPITIEWVCGYGAAGANVPGPIKQAIKLLIADMYEMRESNVVGVSVAKLDMIDRLLMPFRIFRF